VGEPVIVAALGNGNDDVIVVDAVDACDRTPSSQSHHVPVRNAV